MVNFYTAQPSLLYQTRKACILGFESTYLNDADAEFFTQHRPFGYILFARNIESLPQVQHLIQQLYALSPDYIPFIMVDQEGGPVRRFRPPLVLDEPAIGAINACYHDNKAQALSTAYHYGAYHGLFYSELGFASNAAPIGDINFDFTHDIIGRRAFADNSEDVIQLSKAYSDGLKDGGLWPIIKHIPGHGRATQDSHEHLPVVDTPLSTLKQTDFMPFKHHYDAPFAMSAHICYSTLDARNPATQSSIIIQDIIRGYIGFEGLLMSDDISMKALQGGYDERADKALQAGCDLILHCSGKHDEMQQYISVVPNVNKQQADFLSQYAMPTRLTSYYRYHYDIIQPLCQHIMGAGQ